MPKNSLDEKFEKSFENLSLTHKVLIYLLVPLFMGMVLFKIVLPYLDEEEERIKGEMEILKNDIEYNDPKILKKRIETLKKEFLRKKTLQERLKNDYLLLESKLHSLSFRVDDQKIANILNLLLEESLRLDLEIEYIKPVSPKDEKEEKKSGKRVVLKKEIDIKGLGDFASIVYFLHFIEEIDVLSDIKKVELKKEKEKVSFFFKWLIYGVDL